MDRVIYTGKAGRPLGSGALGIYAKDKKDYNKAYSKKRRYVFSVNLDKEKDKELIEILETYKQGNRQGAVKELVLAGYKALTELGYNMQTGFNSGLKGLKDKKNKQA